MAEEVPTRKDYDALRKVLLDPDRCQKLALSWANRTFDEWAAEDGHRPPASMEMIGRDLATNNIKRIHALAESPIEKMFLSALSVLFAARDPVGFCVVPGPPDPANEHCQIYKMLPMLLDNLHLVPQAKIELQGQNLRPDAIIFRPSQKPRIAVCVECDGYEFHSSKERFAADRKRDREFQAVGFQVCRFSGSEIYADPMGVAGSFMSDILLREEENINA